MNIILYLINLVQQLFAQNQYLINFICKYLPVKQMVHDDSRSPKYQKLKVDELPVIKQRYKQDWQFLLKYYEWKYHKVIKPVSRRSGKNTVPEGTVCPICGAPEIYIYDNNGGKGQYQCKVCGNTFHNSDCDYERMHFCCPYCGHTLIAVKNRKFFRIHKCVNPECQYYLRNLKKVDKEDLNSKFKYKLHYIYREFCIDFFEMNLDSLPKNASSLNFTKNNSYIMSLCLTMHVNLQLSLRKTAMAMKDLYGITISHTQVANYCRTAAVVVKPFVDNYPYEKSNKFTADETYIKVRGVKSFVWFVMDTVSRSILGYVASENRTVAPCIHVMRMAFKGWSQLPANFKFIADGYSAYPLAAIQFFERFGEKFKFAITQVIGLTNDDAVSTIYRPYKEMIERLNETFKATYRPTTGYENIDGANYSLSLWVAYYNFLRPHKAFKYHVLNYVRELDEAENMPAKWQMLIYLGQQKILELQNQRIE